MTEDDLLEQLRWEQALAVSGAQDELIGAAAQDLPQARPDIDPVRLQNSIVNFESSGNPYAKNPRSSATGPAQFIDKTWLSLAPTVAQRLGQDLSGMDPNQVLSLRTDRDWSNAAIQVYAEQNKKFLEQTLSRPVGESELRLAHGFGAQGAADILNADPSTKAEEFFSPKVLESNPHLEIGRAHV